MVVSMPADNKVVRISATLISGLTGTSRLLLHPFLISVSLSKGASVSERTEMAAHDTRQITWAALKLW